MDCILWDNYIYIYVGLSALLVSTYRAMREASHSGTSDRLAPRFFFVYGWFNYFILFGADNAFVIMEDKSQKDELQSRREFFKKAAKRALPFIGAIALSALPFSSFAKETEEPETYCDWGCTNSCSGSCGRSCSYGCDGSCAGSCDGSCKGACSRSCSYSCSSTCRGTCSGSCSGGCSYSSRGYY